MFRRYFSCKGTLWRRRRCSVKSLRNENRSLLASLFIIRCKGQINKWPVIFLSDFETFSLLSDSIFDKLRNSNNPLSLNKPHIWLTVHLMLVEETAFQLCMRLLIMMKGMPPGDQMGQPMLYFCTNLNLISTPNPKFLQKQKILQKLPTNVRKASRPSSSSSSPVFRQSRSSSEWSEGC